MMQSDDDDDIQEILYDTLTHNFPEYEFDKRSPPFRSSYDNYHVLGRVKQQSSSQTQLNDTHNRQDHKYIVARVSKHGIRIEREFKQAQLLIKGDSHDDHFLRPLRLIHMRSIKADQTPLIASIVEAPSPQYINDLAHLTSGKQESISYILDFAIGACEALEIIHLKHGLMHGEIRKDAFHFDQITRRVHILNFGSGARSFVSRLTNTGWSDLLLESGIHYKLQFFAPEQTGRLPVEPDMRTDIYALGLGIWTLATGRLPFSGSEPLEIIQAVLSQPLPPISTIRPELQTISQIVTKMTRKLMSDRYNSISSTKRDFEEAKRLHEGGWSTAEFEAGKDDVSPVFKLPTTMIGRVKEQEKVLGVIDAVVAGAVNVVQLNGTSNHIARSSIALMSTDSLASDSPVRKQTTSINGSTRRRSSVTDAFAALQCHEDSVPSIVTIGGKPGYGKTFLLHHLYQAIRPKLLTAIIRLERIKTQPLSPMLKLLSSLFKQIFSNADLDIGIERIIRDQIRPYWPTLCPHLELPVWLLDPVHTRTSTKQITNNAQAGRFTQTLLDALQIVSTQRPVCLMIDDIDLIDDESLELLRAMHNKAMPVIIVMTCGTSRSDADRIERFIKLCTKVELSPLTEEETTTYIAETIHKPQDSCRALASLTYDRTGGVPSNIRTFLESCYTADLITFSWQDRCWRYDLDRIAQCGPATENQESVENAIHQRYRTLSGDMQGLLCWAAMLGVQFNFSLLRDINDASTIAGYDLVPLPICDCLESLQLAISKFIIRPTEDEDLFRFTDDIYWSAACLLNANNNKRTMHFVVAKAMVLDKSETTNIKIYQAAEHIVESLDMVLDHINDRRPFMHSLMTAAVALRTTGSFVKSASFCDAAIELMNEWTAESYHVYSQAAQIYHLVGNSELALSLLRKIEQNVVDIRDRIPTIVTRSRIYADQGDDMSAFDTISSVLEHFQLDIPQTIEECNEAFTCIKDRRTLEIDATPLLSDAIMTSLWMHELVPYQYAAASARIHQTKLNDDSHFIIGVVYLSAVALFQLRDFDLCLQLREQAVQAMSRDSCPRDIWNRALVLRALLFGHLEVGSREQIDHLNQSLEALSTSSDRSLLLLSVATLVVLRVCIADDLESLLQFIDGATDQLRNWEYEKPNGVVLVCTRQVVRTLRGITRIDSADTVMCDDEHDEVAFLQALEDDRYELLRVIYQGCKLVMQNFYGYHREAMELGIPIMPWVDDVRISLFFNAIFYQIGLAIAVVLRQEPDRADREVLLEHVVRIRSRISLIAAAGIPQCEAWMHVLDGEFANDSSSLSSLSLAVETIQGRGSPIEEGICLEIYIRCLVRTGAAVGVQSLIERCSASYAKAGASAKAQQVLQMNGHSIEILPIMPALDLSHSETMEAFGPAWQQTRVNTTKSEEQITSFNDSNTSDESPGHDLESSRQSNGMASKRASQLALGSLDIIDLHSIISSSQAMSSELNIDRLLQSLTNIIAESTGAENCSIVVHAEDDDCWIVASESRSQNAGIKLEDWKDPIAKHVNVFVLRFREELMIHDTMESELFSNVASRQDEGVSVLCLPLIHSGDLLGSVYCQASPNTFTDRTMTLVRLLVTQISICLSNAILFKCLERASAENLSMLVAQKEATEQAKDAEIKAIDNLRQKEEAMKAKDLFLANISHELRTPLNGVIGLADMLQDTRLDSQQADCARSIGVCADTLLSVINDILDFSKLQAGKMQCVNSPILLSQKLRDIVHALRAARSKPGVATIDEIEIDPGLLVLGDLTRLQQVFMNLISNAYKFTSIGKVIVSAVVEGCHDNILTVRFSVKDTGIGIPSHTQHKLFLPFSQADSSTERIYGGTGLGLSICKAIVEEVMGGQIWLESEVDHGTTVTFVIPFEIVDNVSSQAIRPGLSQKSISKSSKQLKICIAEDNAINRKIATSLVSKLGHVVEAFENGRQALDAMYQNDYDIVLMDLQMPVLDGYGATREIRASSTSKIRDIIIIALTASTIKGDQERCIEAGMDAYVTKPVRLPMLKQTIEAFLPP